MPINWLIEKHEEVRSTQDVVKERAETGKLEGLVVRAVAQTNGRGRHGRSWVSGIGNLFFSFLLRPDCPAQRIGVLSLLCGAALGQVMKEYCRDKDIKLKWPNDVYIEGQKCSGILLESKLSDDFRIEWLTIGVGVNIKSAPSNEGTSLNAHAGEDADVDLFLATFLRKVSDLYQSFMNGDDVRILKIWSAMSYPKGTKMSVKLPGHIHSGAFHDIDEQGALLLKSTDGQVQKITAGDVFINVASD